MDIIKPIDKISIINRARNLKKHQLTETEDSAADFKNYLVKPISNYTKNQQNLKKKTADNKSNNRSKDSNNNIQDIAKIKLKELIIAIENSLKKINDYFDRIGKSDYIFYNIEDNKNIVILVADTKTAAIKYKHTICIDCIKSDLDFHQLFSDFLKDKGLLIDITL